MKLAIKYFTLFFSLFAVHAIFAQEIKDDFEGSGTIDNWFGDDCNIRVEVTNPQKKGINTSDKILEYKDLGGTYANVRFETQSKMLV